MEPKSVDLNGVILVFVLSDWFAGVQEEQLDVSPHYDNLAFEGDVSSKSEVRT